MNNNRLHLIRVFGSFLLFVQGLTCFAWWCALVASPTFMSWFIWPGMTERELLGFLGADWVLFAGGSFFSAHALSCTKQWALLAVGITTGAVLYAELLAIGFSLAHGGGWLGVICMAPSALFMIFIAHETYRMERIDVLP